MNFKINHHQFDVLIVGSGGAGLMSAISCKKNNIKNVAVIGKVFPTSSHTVAAKGGINAALGNLDEDKWQWHAFDTMKSGANLADKDSVEYMCKNAPQAIIELEEMGVVFSRFKNGKIYQRSYGGQSKNFGKDGLAHRACCAKDNTGHAILNSLYQKCLSYNVNFFNEFFVTDLLIKNNKCYGAVCINLNQGEIDVFLSKNTIIATGGGSKIYSNSTSANICTGDGSGAILRSDLQLQDMEFIQFHPTGLYGHNILVTEATRAEGGYLINSKGERFMERYSKEFMDLAPRDVIARAISTEIAIGNGCGKNKDHVFLKINHLNRETLNEKLPGLLNLVKSFAKIDASKDLIPVLPLAHYCMGGIPVNQNCQVTYFDGKESVVFDNLLAIGEAACISVHGANRMGCNSLLDIIVFGKLSGEVVANNNNINCQKENISGLILEKINKITHILQKEAKSDLTVDFIKENLQENMQKYVGIFRTKKLLEIGLKNIKKLYQDLKLISVDSKSLFFNDKLINYLEVENLILQSLATIFCALKREESRGSHYRDDYPKLNDKEWQYHSIFGINFEDLSFDFKKKPLRN